MIDAGQIQEEIYRLGERATISRDFLLLRTAPSGDGTPHLEIHGNEFHYVISERGSEFLRKSTTSLDEYLYWFFEAICSDLSYRYELKNRVVGQDVRRIAFSKKIDLLNSVDESWGKKAELEISEILVSAPFVDR